MKGERIKRLLFGTVRIAVIDERCLQNNNSGFVLNTLCDKLTLANEFISRLIKRTVSQLCDV